MTARVLSLPAYRLRQAAIAKGERVRELAEELAKLSNTREGRLYMAGLYEGKGWADPNELLMALREIGAEP